MGLNSGLNEEIKEKHMQELSRFRREVLFKTPRLHSLFFELTGACNEHCRHCGSHCGDFKVRNLLSKEEYFKILSDVKKDFGTKDLRICLTGGEPLLREDFFEIAEEIKRQGFLWGMTSNGTLITKDVAKKLYESGMKTISVSVDGLKNTHDWFRESPGSYERTMEGIKNLLEYPFAHVQITTVVHSKNYKELNKMYKIFSKIGVKSWRVINIEPIGRALSNKELLLNPRQLKGLIHFIEKKRFAGKMEVVFGCSHYLGPEYEREVRPWYFLCNAGIYTAGILHNGDITACLDIERRPELIQGNIRKDSLKEVWENRFEVFRSDYRKCGKCAECEDYVYCGGDSFHTWNFDTMQPNLCMKEIL